MYVCVCMCFLSVGIANILQTPKAKGNNNIKTSLRETLRLCACLSVFWLPLRTPRNWPQANLHILIIHAFLRLIRGALFFLLLLRLCFVAGGQSKDRPLPLASCLLPLATCYDSQFSSSKCHFSTSQQTERISISFLLAAGAEAFPSTCCYC